MNWSMVLAQNAAEYPDKEGLVCEDRRQSFAETNQRVNALAQALLDLGVRRGDRVAILLLNCLEYFELSFAVNQIGAVWLPLNFRLAPPEIQFILDNGGATLLVTEAQFAETVAEIRPSLPELQKVIYTGSQAPQGELSYEELLVSRQGALVEHTEVALDDLHRLVYTSGTTAHPKGVMLTFGNLFWKNMGHIITFDLGPQDTTLVVGPLYHVGGMDLPATGTLQVGGKVVILPRFDPQKLLETVARERISNMWLAPAMINMLFQEPSFGDHDLSSLRFIIDGGEKMPAPLIEEFRRRFPKGVWFADAYGLSETVSGDTFLAKEYMVSKLGSVGKPVPMLRVRVVDSDDNDLPAGELGEIVLKGPKVFKGYWQNQKATDEALRNGWFHTGDIGRLDEEGFLYIEDRKKDMILSGGENIASPEVERVLYQHPAVLEAAVIGIPHPKWQEVPKAFIVLHPGAQASPQELSEHCRRQLAKFKVPAEYEFIEALPRNPSGKVLKRVLRQQQQEEA